MNNDPLKDLLLETHPILPGQEARAWEKTRPLLFLKPTSKSMLFWGFLTTYPLRFAGAGAALLLTVGLAFTLMQSTMHPVASADSTAPGIYATSYYSDTAQAEVITVKGLPPAKDDEAAPNTNTPPNSL